MTAPKTAPTDRRAGRPYDHSGDALILENALDLLAERDYERVTLDEIAARTGKAKTTLYRRWATKEDLVLAAIRAAGQPFELVELPDRGTLRADLLAVVDSSWLGGPARRLSILTGLVSAARTSQRLADVVRLEVTAPYVETYRRLLQRASDRGEIPPRPTSSLALLAEVIPAMSTHRLTAGGNPVQRDFFVSVVDDILLAALATSGR